MGDASSSKELSDRIVRCPFTPDALEVRRENFIRTLWTSLEQNGSKLALVEVGSVERATYSELMSRASLVARRLLSHGCRPGDVVAVYSPNSIAWIVVYLAACRIAAIPAAVNPLLTADELHRNLQTCGAKFVFTTRELLQTVRNATVGIDNETAINSSYDGQKVLMSGSTLDADCVDVEAVPFSGERLQSLPSIDSLNIRPDDPAAVFFSSGTTGPQKGVVMSNRNLQHALSTATHPKSAIVFPVQLAFGPFAHVTGGLVTVIGIAAGFTTYLMIRFNLEQFLRTIDENEVEGTLLVPPVATMMLKSPLSLKYKLKSLKKVVIGAMPVSAQLENELMERYPGLSVRQRYAMTESTSAFCGAPFDDEHQKFVRKPGSVGVPVPGVLMKVIDLKTGEAVQPNQSGEICIMSPLVMLGYINNKRATAETVDSIGWLHTGDIGHYDEDGYFYVSDRLKELIKYNAFQVPPSELEAVLLSHPEVVDAGVVGLPDAEHGELPLAWVVKKPNATVTEQQLKQFVDGKVAPFKKLRGGVHFVAAIPRTASGKILRREMKATLLKAQY